MAELELSGIWLLTKAIPVPGVPPAGVTPLGSIGAVWWWESVGAGWLSAQFRLRFGDAGPQGALSVCLLRRTVSTPQGGLCLRRKADWRVGGPAEPIGW